MKIPTNPGELTIDYMIHLLEAARAGKQLQWRSWLPGCDWFDWPVGAIPFRWDAECYRVKEEA